VLTAPLAAHHCEMVELCRADAARPLRAANHDVAQRLLEIGNALNTCTTGDISMSEDIDVKINVDTLMDGDQYFVRTEIETRSVTIQGPFPDLQKAQKLKAEQIEHRSKAIDAIKRNLHETVYGLASR
jgi:hypothetical protein